MWLSVHNPYCVCVLVCLCLCVRVCVRACDVLNVLVCVVEQSMYIDTLRYLWSSMGSSSAMLRAAKSVRLAPT